MFEFLEIHVVQGERSVPEIIKNESEQLRVPVNEDGSVVILVGLDPTTQKT